MKFLLTFLVSLAATSIAAAKEPADEKLATASAPAEDPEHARLRSYFIDETPVITGFFSLLGNARQSAPYRNRLDRIFLSDPKLNALSANGQSFLAAYKLYLAQDFGERYLGFAIEPEQEIMRRLYATDRVRKTTLQEAQRKDIEAQTLALRETGFRFGLGSNASISDIEKRRFSDRNGEAIYQFYRQRYIRYLITPVDKQQPNPDSIMQFKRRMVAILEELKEKNFTAFVQRTITSDEFRLDLWAAKGPIEIDSKDIQSVSVRLLPTAQVNSSSSVQYVDTIRNIWQKFLERRGFSWKQADTKTAAQVYEPPKIFPNTAPRMVRVAIQMKDGTTRDVTITETSFSKWINGISPDGYFGGDKDDLVLRRYLLEASARNALYTDLIAFLEENDDREVEPFRMRLQTRIIGYQQERTYDYQTITERLRTFADTTNANSPLYFAFWNGIGIHPDYWNIREDVALTIKVAKPLRGVDIDPANLSKLTAKQKAAIAKEKKQEKYRNRFRYQSDAARVRYGLARRFRQLMIAGAVAGTAWASYERAETGHWPGLDININMPSFHGPSLPHSQTMANLGKEIASFMKRLFSLDSTGHQTGRDPGGKRDSADGKPDSSGPSMFRFHIHKKSSLSMSNFDSPQNFNLGGDGRDHSKDKTGSFETNQFGFQMPFKIDGDTDNVIYILVPNKIDISALPRVYDVIRLQNLTQKILDDEDSENEPASDAALMDFSKTDPVVGQFSVITNIVNYADDGRIPIAVPDGSRLVGIEVRNEQMETLQEGVDYKIYRLRTNHLLWIKLSPSLRSAGIGYKAEYDFDRVSHVTDPALVQFQTKYLASVNRQFLQAGFTQTGKAINVLESGQPAVLADDLSTTFSTSSTYTYSSKEWPIRGDDSNPFKPFTRFVDENGLLNDQCSGSNFLFAFYENQYYQRAGLSGRFKADNMTAYAVTGNAPVVTFDGSHIRTVDFEIGGDQDYQILDATPGGTFGPESNIHGPLVKAPVYHIGGKHAKTASTKPPEFVNYAILSEPNQIPRPIENTVADGPLPPKPPSEPVDEKQSLLQKRTRELMFLRGGMTRWIVDLSQANGWARASDGPEHIPGLAIASVASLLQEYVFGQIKEDYFLTRMISISIRWPQNSRLYASLTKSAQERLAALRAQGLSSNEIIRQTVVQLEATYQREMHYVDQETRTERGTEVEFVLDRDYETLIKKLSTLMSQTEWGLLEGRYREEILPKSEACEPLLSARRRQ